MSRAALRVRRAARLLMLDDLGRVLLFPFQPQGTDGPIEYWFTPGGGVEEGETVAEAAQRECFEETGFVLAERGEALATRQFELTLLDGERVWAEEHYFIVQVGDHQPDSRGWTAQERACMGAARWFDREMLASPPQAVFPEGLASILAARQV